MTFLEVLGCVEIAQCSAILVLGGYAIWHSRPPTPPSHPRMRAINGGRR